MYVYGIGAIAVLLAVVVLFVGAAIGSAARKVAEREGANDDDRHQTAT
jgi:hypothetical protein